MKRVVKSIQKFPEAAANGPAAVNTALTINVYPTNARPPNHSAKIPARIFQFLKSLIVIKPFRIYHSQLM